MRNATDVTTRQPDTSYFRVFEMGIWPLFIPPALVFLVLCVCGVSWLWLLLPPDVVLFSAPIISVVCGVVVMLMNTPRELELNVPMTIKGLCGPMFFVMLSIWPGYIYTLTQAYERTRSYNELEPLPEPLFMYKPFSADHVFWMAALILVGILAWTLVLSIKVYIPGDIIRSGQHSEKDFQWMAGESTFTQQQRIEIGRHLATLSPDSVKRALVMNLKDPTRIDIAAEHMLTDFSPDTLRALCEEVMPRMDRDDIDRVMEVWKAREDRARALTTLIEIPTLQQSTTWAPVLFKDVLVYSPTPAAPDVAMTTLLTTQLSLHDAATKHIKAHALPAHIKRLWEIKQSFSLNPTHESRVQGILDYLTDKYGVGQGQLSLAEDASSRGGLTSANDTEP